jgi:hypothetical protein
VNCTFVGDHRQGPLWPGPTSGVNMRNGRMAGTCLNSIEYKFKLAALKIDTNDIWRPHCENMPVEPASYTLSVDPIKTGSMFVANGRPNPFSRRFAVSFALPKAGHVTVEVFSADGRRVQVLADQDMVAGQHSVTWNVDRSVRTGMYFYKVRSGGLQSTGKFIRVD